MLVSPGESLIVTASLVRACAPRLPGVGDRKVASRRAEGADGRHQAMGARWHHGRGTPPIKEVLVTEAELRELLASSKVIAVVGLSPNADRPSNQVAWYLHHQGYELYGVNPVFGNGEAFGVPVLERLDQVPK